ncbi:hypothetical protein M404DRAFT_996301 [Pisolithus tinctorius Marx 270]|uniref:Uncharacterized protein n=1 Tax=Pisolithus tinctorius Marx 270 TaxID=870435 RepID=A0A0C3P7R1_PISTI|nr:hypothetical protein M404DRAFT_996301 [Pisolithus tinctorius Marx 270]
MSSPVEWAQNGRDRCPELARRHTRHRIRDWWIRKEEESFNRWRRPRTIDSG